MLPLLLDSAARSLLLGLAVWLTLKLVRLRDTRTETAIWTAVLIVALSMPLLSHYSPALVVPVPHLAAAPHQAPTAAGLHSGGLYLPGPPGLRPAAVLATLSARHTGARRLDSWPPRARPCHTERPRLLRAGHPATRRLR